VALPATAWVTACRPRGKGNNVPDMEVAESDGERHVQLALPGFGAKDIRAAVTCQDGDRGEEEITHQHQHSNRTVHFCELSGLERSAWSLFRSPQMNGGRDCSKIEPQRGTKEKPESRSLEAAESYLLKGEKR